MKRKLTCSILALTIALGGIAYANPEVEEINQNINAVQTELSGLQESANAVAALDQQAAEMNGRLSSLENSEATANNELANLSSQYEQDKSEVLEKVNELYSKGETYEGALMSNENIAEYFNQVETMKQVAIDNPELYQKIKAAKENLNNKQSEIVAIQAQITPLREEIEQLKSQIVEYADVRARVTELNNQLQALEAQKTEIARLEEAEKASNVVSIAQQYLGTPYVWGGTTPNGFDCSGFVQYVYAQAGISIPRVTTGQEYAGVDVTGQELQPGDLVFWGSRGATYHVGMYIGDGQYVHSPQTGDVVRIAKLNGYSVARRIMN